MQSIVSSCFSTTLLVGACFAQGDVIMRSVGPNPVLGESGSRVEVTYVVRNNRTVDLDDSTIGFYFSNDDTLDPSDMLLETEEINIDPFESEGDSEQFRLPSSLAPGSYFLIVKVDIYDRVAETNEQNNARAVALEITSGNVRATATTRLPCNAPTIPDSLETSLARIGDDSVGFIDDPTNAANMPLGTQTYWLVSGAPAMGAPCGVVVPELGIGSNPGEILIDLANPLSVPRQFDWDGPGQPAWHPLDFPRDLTLIGVNLFTQGVFVTPSGDMIVTNAVDLVVGV